jgi:hypothetical protein
MKKSVALLLALLVLMGFARDASARKKIRIRPRPTPARPR